jgi:hypothetical protein
MPNRWIHYGRQRGEIDGAFAGAGGQVREAGGAPVEAEEVAETAPQDAVRGGGDNPADEHVCEAPL